VTERESKPCCGGRRARNGDTSRGTARVRSRGSACSHLNSELVSLKAFSYDPKHDMGLGTKNRQKQTADICKQHLREKYSDKLGLVEEFIVEFEGARKNCDVTRWASSTTSKTSQKRCSNASACSSRSGSIRKSDETRANNGRVEKDRHCYCCW